MFTISGVTPCRNVRGFLFAPFVSNLAGGKIFSGKYF
jgi:hypothetical protein